MNDRRKAIFYLYCRVAIALVCVAGARRVADYLIEMAPAFREPIESAFSLVVGIGTVAYVFLPFLSANGSKASNAAPVRAYDFSVNPTSGSEFTLRILELSRVVGMVGLAVFAASVFVVHDNRIQLLCAIPFAGACFVESLIGYRRPDLVQAEGRSALQSILSSASPYRKWTLSNGERLGLCILTGTLFFGALAVSLLLFVR
jgi:hypothetical protein